MGTKVLGKENGNDDAETLPNKSFPDKRETRFLEGFGDQILHYVIDFDKTCIG